MKLYRVSCIVFAPPLPRNGMSRHAWSESACMLASCLHCVPRCSPGRPPTTPLMVPSRGRHSSLHQPGDARGLDQGTLLERPLFCLQFVLWAQDGTLGRQVDTLPTGASGNLRKRFKAHAWGAQWAPSVCFELFALSPAGKVYATYVRKTHVAPRRPKPSRFGRQRRDMCFPCQTASLEGQAIGVRALDTPCPPRGAKGCPARARRACATGRSGFLGGQSLLRAHAG